MKGTENCTEKRPYITLKGKSGKKFGIHRNMDTAGAPLGVLLATLLIYVGAENRTVTLIGGVLSFFSLIPVNYSSLK